MGNRPCYEPGNQVETPTLLYARGLVVNFEGIILVERSKTDTIRSESSDKPFSVDRLPAAAEQASKNKRTESKWACKRA